MTLPTPETVAAMPALITVIGPAYPAFAEAAVHIRNGMIFHPDRPVELFQNGNASFHLVMGNPGQIALDMAQASRETAQLMEVERFNVAVRQAAKQLVEDEKRAALEKQVADAVAASEKEIAKLKKAAEAELARLSQ